MDRINKDENWSYILEWSVDYVKIDETVNHIISKYSWLAQKEYKSRRHWVGNVIHWELSKTLKFANTTNWYIHEPESVLENESNKILWGIEIQSDHQILARRHRLCVDKQEKRTCQIEDFAVHTDDRVKMKKRKKTDKYLILV